MWWIWFKRVTQTFYNSIYNNKEKEKGIQKKSACYT